MAGTSQERSGGKRANLSFITEWSGMMEKRQSGTLIDISYLLVWASTKFWEPQKAMSNLPSVFAENQWVGQTIGAFVIWSEKPWMWRHVLIWLKVCFLLLCSLKPWRSPVECFSVPVLLNIFQVCGVKEGLRDSKSIF